MISQIITRVMMEKQMSKMKSGHVATVAIAFVALYVLATADNNLFRLKAIHAAPKAPIPLTPSLADWVSSQSENIIEEMEAIVKQQVRTDKFSVVFYLRYLNLFDNLKVVADKKHVKFEWIAKKVKVFRRVYDSIYNIVEAYLHDLDSRMHNIEKAEKKGRQSSPNSAWVTIYETINYIKIHAPKSSTMAQKAIDIMQKSPNDSPDRRRSTRYALYRNAHN